jgi:hypothetical protein
VDVPADTADDPRAREYIVDHLQPGVSITRRVEISNTTDADLQVAVYAAPAKIENETFRGEVGRAKSALTSWITFSENIITVPPGGAVLDSVTITVPRDAAPGEQYGVIWAEVKGTGNGPVALTARTGVRVYLSVGGNNPPASQFNITSVAAERAADGTAAITAVVNNTGGRALDLSGTLKMEAVNGALSGGPYPVVVGTTLAPDDTGPVRAVITDDVANGPWKVSLELHSGSLSETATAEVSFPDAGSAEPVAVDTSDGPPLAMIGLIVAALVLIAGLLGFFLRRKRIQSASNSNHDGPVDS